MRVTEARTSTNRRPLWVLAKTLAAVIALLAFGVLSMGEVRSFLLYEVAPQRARDANFIKLTRGPLEVFVLGTIHGKHLSTPDFSLAHLGAAIEALKPDVLLVEARPEELARGRFGDGPIEMPYATLFARARSIPVEGIDWWQPQGSLRRTDDNRDDRIFELLKERLPPSGTVLVLIGYSHVPEQRDRLQAEGFLPGVFTDDDKRRVFELGPEPFTFPPGMGEAIRQRIEDAEEAARSSPDDVAAKFRAVAESRRRYLAEIERVGGS